ncbi:quinon protein alcohol dehydrogenase-like superfamily [Aspergillus avenaceus]|uniref:Quinon protein alcohol dehydrogenase-like superfamily n=1 Tax=Aspergillus avenaceus TaxID=36643 RepID=A0A5N6U886_ASPAV|nr:quinon protein alcohol dehydrogenase-like superfamily [Aspergillus avenaceus]
MAPIPNSIYTFKDHSGKVFSTAFSPGDSPEDRLVASGSDTDNTVFIWKAKDGQVLQTLSHATQVNSVAFSHDGELVATASNSPTVHIWNIKDGTLLKELDVGSKYVSSVAFSGDGKLLAAGSSDNAVNIWKTEDFTLFKTFNDHEQPVNSVAFSPDSTLLASGSDDKTVNIWRLDGNGPPHTLKGHEKQVMSVAFSFDSQKVASGSLDKSAKIWAVDGDQPLLTLDHDCWVYSVAFSPRPGDWSVASGSGDGTVNNVQVWDADDGTVSGILQEHTDRVFSVAFSQDGKFIVSGSGDKSVKIWDTNTQDWSCIHTLNHGGRVRSVAFSPDGNYIASGSSDGTVKIWDTNTPDWECVYALDSGANESASIAFTPNSEYVGSGGGYPDGEITIWKFKESTDPFFTLSPKGSVTSIAFSPEDGLMAAGFNEGNVEIWNFENSSDPHYTVNNGGSVETVAFSSVGEYVASAGWSPHVKIFKFKESTTPRFTLDHVDESGGVYLTTAFSSDGRYIASGLSDNEGKENATVKVWDYEHSTNPCFTFTTGNRPSFDRVHSVAFLPNGRYVAASSSTMVMIWKLRNGAIPYKLDHGDFVHSVAVSPTGEYIASGAVDGKIKIWAGDLP